MINKAKYSILSLFLLVCLPMMVNATVTLPSIPTTQFSIITYGASTSNTDNSSAINAAITAANAAGGTVIIPAGTFLSGPITMKSNVNLHLAAGAILQILPYGTGNGTPAGSYPNNGTTDQYNPFIYGSGLSNIAVTGTGTIEGNGSAWWTAFASNSNMKRPSLIRFKACNKVLVDSITLQNSPGVHVTYGQSGSSYGANGTITNIKVSAPSNSPNTDAIDTWYWNGINIFNCNLSEGDDNVAMDSYSSNINIKHCTFGSGHGVSVGSYTINVENVNVDSCTFTNTTNGIRLKSDRDRGGNDSIFTYSNITMTNVTNPIYISDYYERSSQPAPDTVATVPIISTTPFWSKILLKNITITGSPNAGLIFGRPEAPITNIEFDNVQISATTSGMDAYFVNGLVFNCSNITLPSGKGNAIIPYGATISGINTTTGVSTICTEPTLSFSSGSTVESVPQGSAITNIVYTYAGSATGATATGLPAGVIATVDTNTKTITLSGTPTTTGIYNYTITTVATGSDFATITGKIIVASPTAKKIAYMTIPNSAADNLILNKLEGNADFALTVIDATLSSVDYSGYDLIVMSPVPSSSASGFAPLKGYNKPELLLKPFTLKSGTSTWSWGTAVNTAANTSTITVTNKSHIIFSNLSFTGASNDQLQLFNTVSTNGVTGITSTSWVGSPVSQLAIALGTSTTQSIVEIPVGTSMNGTTVPQRFLMIGVSESSTANLTATATQLIENSCYYLLGISIPATTIKESKTGSQFKIIQTATSIYVDTNEEINGLELYSATGSKITTSNSKTISTANLAQGVYIINVKTKLQNNYIKIIKK